MSKYTVRRVRRLVIYKMENTDRFMVLIRQSQNGTISFFKRTQAGRRELSRVFQQLRKQYNIANQFVVCCPESYVQLQSMKTSMRHIEERIGASELDSRTPILGFD